MKNFFEKTERKLKINTVLEATVKIEYDPRKKGGNAFAVYEKTITWAFWETWRFVGEHKTLSAAEESANSRAQRVTYLGVFENGVKKAMTGWHDMETISHPVLPTTPPPDEEIKFTRVERKK